MKGDAIFWAGLFICVILFAHNSDTPSIGAGIATWLMTQAAATLAQ